MRPTLEPGDRILVLQWSRAWRPGDVIVFAEPDARRTFSVKRISEIDAVGVRVRGDNPNVSRDSREYGSVPQSFISGRAIYIYAPRARRGRARLSPSMGG